MRVPTVCSTNQPNTNHSMFVELQDHFIFRPEHNRLVTIIGLVTKLYMDLPSLQESYKCQITQISQRLLTSDPHLIFYDVER